MAALALIFDVVTVALVYRTSRDNLNIRAAFVHNVSDALATVGVKVAGTVIILYEWYVVDLLVTVAISGYILYQGISMMRQTIRILMEGVPEDMGLDAVVEEMMGVHGVEDVHHVHIRELDEQHRALEAHVVIERDDLVWMEHLKRELKVQLEDVFDIQHSTLEFEIQPQPSVAGCEDASVVPSSDT